MLRTIVAATTLSSIASVAMAADAGQSFPVPGPAVAGPTVAGDLSLSVGGLFYNGTHIYNLFDTLGRVNVPLHGTKNLEIEAGGGALFVGGGSEPLYIDAVAHLWGMRSPTAAWGLFGGTVFGQGPHTWMAGAEAKHFLANGSLGGSAAVYVCCSGDAAGAFSIAYNHYFNPNHRFGVRGGVFTDFSFAAWDITADIEHRFTHPVSLFAAVSYAGGDIGPGGLWTVKGGLKLYLDSPGDTLQSHETKVPWTAWIPQYITLLD